MNSFICELIHLWTHQPNNSPIHELIHPWARPSINLSTHHLINPRTHPSVNSSIHELNPSMNSPIHVLWIYTKQSHHIHRVGIRQTEVQTYCRVGKLEAMENTPGKMPVEIGCTGPEAWGTRMFVPFRDCPCRLLYICVQVVFKWCSSGVQELVNVRRYQSPLTNHSIISFLGR